MLSLPQPVLVGQGRSRERAGSYPPAGTDRRLMG
jgi:hypothetical protein